MDQYTKEARDHVRNQGVRDVLFTDQQVKLFVQPYFAPEDFHMDGEINPRQAVARWKERLKESGLSNGQVTWAIARFL